MGFGREDGDGGGSSRRWRRGGKEGGRPGRGPWRREKGGRQWQGGTMDLTEKRERTGEGSRWWGDSTAERERREAVAVVGSAGGGSTRRRRRGGEEERGRRLRRSGSRRQRGKKKKVRGARRQSETVKRAKVVSKEERNGRGRKKAVLAMEEAVTMNEDGDGFTGVEDEVKRERREGTERTKAGERRTVELVERKMEEIQVFGQRRLGCGGDGKGRERSAERRKAVEKREERNEESSERRERYFFFFLLFLSFFLK